MSANRQVISFEGMDGSSKKTQSLLTLDAMRASSNQPWEYVDFPAYNDEYYGYLVDHVLSKPLPDSPSLAEAYQRSLSFIINRMAFFKKHTIPDNVNIIANRYYTSNILYQTAHLSDADKIAYYNFAEKIETEIGGVPKATKIFALRVNPKLSIQNMINRGATLDNYETLETQERIYDNIQFFADNFGWIIVECSDDKKMYDRQEINKQFLQHM